MLDFDNSYAQLSDSFFERVEPTPVSTPTLIKLNKKLSLQLGLDHEDLSHNKAGEIFSGNGILQGSEPLAMVYAGHQFAGWRPQLGDGRAILLGEVIDVFGERQDIQLKGSGRTRFSRTGDGRAALGPVLREYVISEAMAAMNIPTTRALAVVLTGEEVYRKTPLPGAILTRVSKSHIRVGTFQYFASQGDYSSLKTLADYVINRHYPDLKETTNPYLGLLEKVVSTQASLISKWMGLGFIHGVMNTDNVLISGQTLDFGPCAFMDHYDPTTVFSSIDVIGRYRYENQPYIGQCNCTYFASSILSLISTNEEKAKECATAVLNTYQDQYRKAWSIELNEKIGLSEVRLGDEQLGQDLLDIMAHHQLDFTHTFRKLSKLSSLRSAQDDPILHDWLMKWRFRLQTQQRSSKARQTAMKAKNPAYIPRNHQIENMISSALEGDFEPFDSLNAVLEKPFEEREEYLGFFQPPANRDEGYRTFCGT
ncbi:conserved hypothetical protein [Candidatus Terasakiella magnetica]|uniref:Protein nucleotidyltransferase YdiU n=1 Tax=Candidatus Terasakiella magnetica TaxID=1867952 RepID=A0A1C3RFD4_9PROT|nr:YdiU family protein [Candidatus Terasakiella magnetica]SCA56006.1 conserved hypothetical protein [Candidatus Terasakiella magnetica]